MLHIAYVTLYFLQSVKLEMTPETLESAENPSLEHTLFPKNGPVFMRRIYTEPTVVFNGTLSFPVWKYIDITVPSTTTQASVNDMFPAYNLIKSNQNAPISPDYSNPNIARSLNLNVKFRSITKDLPFPSKAYLRQGISSETNGDNTSNPEDLIPSSTSITLSSNPVNSVDLNLSLITTSQNIVNPFISNESISSAINVSIPSTVAYLPTTSHIDITEKESDIADLSVIATPESPTVRTAETYEPDIRVPQRTTTSFIYTEITATSTEPTEILDVHYPISDAKPIYDFTEIGPQKLLRMHTFETTEQNSKIQTHHFGSREPTEQKPPWLESTKQPAYLQQNTQVVSDQQEMEDVGMDTEPFSTFLRKLLQALTTKHESYLLKLIKPFEKYIATLVDGGKLMKLGAATSVWITQETQILRAPITDLQRLIFVGHVYLEHRRKMLSNDINTILDDMDDVYDANEEENMQRVLSEVRAFPNTTKTGELIARDFVYDVFVWPMNRVAGTTRGKTLFQQIGKIANKYNARRYEVNDENELIDQSPGHEELNREYPKVRHEENKSIDPPLVSEVLVKSNGKNINKKRKPILPSKDLPDYIKILKDRKFEDSSSSEHNAESSRSDSDGIEIRIKIRKGKYSVKNLTRNLTNAGNI